MVFPTPIYPTPTPNKSRENPLSLLICFHTPTLKSPATSLEHQSPLKLLYFASTTKGLFGLVITSLLPLAGFELATSK